MNRLAIRAALHSAVILRTLFVVAVWSSSANAAFVTLTLVLDSPTLTCGGCTLSGPGTYKLLAESSPGDNFGIARFAIPILGVTTVFPRSPRTNVLDPEDEVYPAGFTLFRSASNQIAIPGGFIVQAIQDTTTPTLYLIRGFGQKASSFASELPGKTFISPQSQTSWDTEVVLTEGSYAQGANPHIDTNSLDLGVSVFSQANGLALELSSVQTRMCYLYCGEGALIVDDFSSVADLNEIVSTTMTASGVGTLSWSDLQNFNYTPMFGAVPGAPGLAKQPTWNPATQAFEWDTSGSSRGRYAWEVVATDFFGFERGSITVNVPHVPEPPTRILLGFALIGGERLSRRRKR